MKPKFLGSLILIIMLFSGLALGDKIPIGYESVSYCFTIENQEEFTEYNFIWVGTLVLESSLISPGDCISFYKYSSPIIYAVKKSDFSLENYNNLKAAYQQGPYQEEHDAYQKELEKMEKNLKFMKSNLNIHSYGLVSEYDPLKSAKDVLRIKVLNDEQFVLEKDKIIYTYEDGTSEEISYLDKSVHRNIETGFMEPSKTTIFPPWTNTALFLGGAVISLAALVIIIVILVKRFRK